MLSVFAAEVVHGQDMHWLANVDTTPNSTVAPQPGASQGRGPTSNSAVSLLFSIFPLYFLSSPLLSLRSLPSLLPFVSSPSLLSPFSSFSLLSPPSFLSSLFSLLFLLFSLLLLFLLFVLLSSLLPISW